MTNAKPMRSLSGVLDLLHAEHKKAVLLLSESGGTADRLAMKLALDRAIAVIEQAESLGLTGREQSTVIPPTRVQSPSAAYRVIDDNESDDCTLWTTTDINLTEGDILLHKS